MKPYDSLICLLLLLTSCSQQTSLPACLQDPQTLPHQRMRDVMDIVKPENLLQYQYMEGGNLEDREEQWTSIQEVSPIVFSQQTVSNIYEAENGSKEYYVSEFRLDVSDTVNRQAVLNYQFIVDADTAFLSVMDEQEARFTGITYKGAYLIEGFAHAGDPQPGQYRWWSPELGEWVIWYGEDRFYRMVRPMNEERRILVQELLVYFQQMSD